MTTTAWRGRKAPIVIEINHADKGKALDNLSVAKARALADLLHDLCDEAEKDGRQ